MRACALTIAGAALLSCGPVIERDGDAVPLWGRWESSFTADGDVPETARFTVQFTSPSGVARTVDGFWDGESTWTVRFMPGEAGRWTYQTDVEPEAGGLSGLEGSFSVAASEAPETRFLTHGPVRVSDDRRHLAHADGKPFLWIADTAWNGALMSSDEEWGAYLDDRRTKSFSAVQLVTTQWRAALANAEGEVAYTGFDDIRINPRFFDRMDRRIDEVNAAGLLAAPVLLWTLGEPERNPGRLPESQAIRLARYIVARYQANHVIWFLAGDENFSGETGERWRRIGRGVFAGREHAPATLHPQGRQWFFDEFANEDWLDLIIYQSSHGGGPQTLEWLQSGPPSQKWSQEPTRPVLNSEPGYEDILALEIGEPHTADDVRPQLWWSLLNAPSAGVTYGAHGIWSWEREAAVALNHDRFGVAQPWSDALAFPGSAQAGHLADFFGEIAWWTLRPRPELVTEQSEDRRAHVAVAASEDGRLLVAYLPVGGALRLQGAENWQGMDATWFNPRTGERVPGTAADLSAPADGDWVLLLTAR